MLWKFSDWGFFYKVLFLPDNETWQKKYNNKMSTSPRKHYRLHVRDILSFIPLTCSFFGPCTWRHHLEILMVICICVLRYEISSSLEKAMYSESFARAVHCFREWRRNLISQDTNTNNCYIPRHRLIRVEREKFQWLFRCAQPFRRDSRHCATFYCVKIVRRHCSSLCKTFWLTSHQTDIPTRLDITSTSR